MGVTDDDLKTTERAYRKSQSRRKAKSVAGDKAKPRDGESAARRRLSAFLPLFPFIISTRISHAELHRSCYLRLIQI